MVRFLFLQFSVQLTLALIILDRIRILLRSDPLVRACTSTAVFGAGEILFWVSIFVYAYVCESCTPGTGGLLTGSCECENVIYIYIFVICTCAVVPILIIQYTRVYWVKATLVTVKLIQTSLSTRGSDTPILGLAYTYSFRHT